MKKIIIFIITILILGVIAMYSCIQNSKRIQDDKIKNDDNNLEIAEITNEPKEENTEAIIEQPKAIDNTEATKKEKIPKETSNEIKKDNSNIKASKQPKSNNSNQISENVNEKKNEPNKEVKTENKVIQKDETKQQQTSDTKKEEYKRNNRMIEKMKNIIQKNETEDMKKYGYEIVVDSSIKEMTNQFTYTEDRVKQKITWKFGTIKIYAEDYYCNGQYIMTECYII